jgi:hypothetical protein
MTQKHHQEEISGPVDLTEAAELAKDLPRPKRARILSRKARENQAKISTFEVHSDHTAPVPADSSSAVGINASTDKRTQRQQRQTSFVQEARKA